MEYLDETAQDELAERLLRGTAAGKYQWTQSGDDQFTFLLRARRFGFALESRDRDDFAPFKLHIFDMTGTPMELQSLETTAYRPRISGLLEDLYSTVKRKTLELDTVAEDIFSALDSLDSEN